MRVGFNARLLAAPDLRGFNRYTAELVRALEASGRAEVVLFADAPIHPVHGLGGVPAVWQAVRPQWRWQHGWLPRALRRERVDIFHAPAHWGVPWRSDCPVVATIHDLADRELAWAHAGGPWRAVLRHRLEERLVVRRAKRIITVSEWSARSIVRHLGVPRSRVAVTVEGAAPPFETAEAEERVTDTLAALALSPPYFLCVGGFEARKNLQLVVTALSHTAPEARVQVVIAGARDRNAEALERAAAHAGVAAWLRLVGPVDDGVLAALYRSALAVLMPSWLEGFGLPVVEAMHAGVPAIVSDAGSLPELVGDAGLIVSPSDPAALASAMHELACDAERRRALAERARARAPRYTWRAAAEQTLAVYAEVLGARRAPMVC